MPVVTIPVIEVGTGNQTKVVEPVLLVGLNANGVLTPVAVTADGKLKLAS